METTISNFHTFFYIPVIQKVAFDIPHVKILGTNHCGDSRQTAFKRHQSFQDVLCCRDFAEMVFADFDNLIQSEYYGGNKSVSIKGISCTEHAVFQYFLLGGSKQDTSTTTSHSKHFIELLKKQKQLTSTLGTIW